MADRCKSCGAEIVWAETPSGRAMPLDAKPEKRVIGHVTRDGRVDDAHVVDTWTSHFATCPHANEHRRKR